MRSITPAILSARLQQGEQVFLVDVREDFEHEDYNIGGTLIPLGEVVRQSDKIPQDTDVIFYCRKGIRSQIAIQRLQEKFGYDNLINLEGGMEAWRKMTGE